MVFCVSTDSVKIMEILSQNQIIEDRWQTNQAPPPEPWGTKLRPPAHLGQNQLKGLAASAADLGRGPKKSEI